MFFDIDLVAIHLISRSNQQLHQDPESLLMSQTVNSKMHLARTAEEHNIPVPQTFVCSKNNLDSPEAALQLYQKAKSNASSISIDLERRGEKVSKDVTITP